MKIKATKKEMREGYNRIIGVGYCGADCLLRYIDPIAYSAGVYGWSCDYYNVNGVLISTGYSPLSDKNVTRNYDLIRKYDETARAIVTDYSMDYDTQKSRVNGLLNAFIAEYTGGKQK